MTSEPDLASFAAALGRALHDEGVVVPTARTASLAAALAAVAPATSAELYWVGRVTLLTDHEQLAAYDRVFHRLFGSADVAGLDPAEFRGDQRALSSEAPAAPGGSGTTPTMSPTWTPPLLVARHLASQRRDPDPSEQPDDASSVIAARSAEELVRERDLPDLAEHELSDLRRLAALLRNEPPLRRSRRSRPDKSGRRVDLRASLRAAVRTGGDPVRLVHRRPRTKRRRLVLLCDVSGSMEAYARPYLQLLSGASMAGHAEAFVFATQLTRVTRALRTVRATRLAAEAGRAAPDWGGGTRIGIAMRTFLDGYGRRGMARGAVVVVLSDGWEAGDPELLGEQMDRLARLAHRIVWVNPRLAAPGFQPLTGGLSAALPHVDRALSGHSLSAMEEVLAAVRDSR